MKTKIEKEIRKAINRHLVTHVQTPNDTRDRIDILVDEAATEILKLVVQPDVSGQFSLALVKKAFETFHCWFPAQSSNVGRMG